MRACGFRRLFQWLQVAERLRSNCCGSWSFDCRDSIVLRQSSTTTPVFRATAVNTPQLVATEPVYSSEQSK